MSIKGGGLPPSTSYLISSYDLTATGSSQTDAAPINTKPPAMIYVLGANGTKGVLLPKCVAGTRVVIKNDDGANAVLKVYPLEASGVQINALTAGAAISMAAKTVAEFIARQGNAQWVTLPLLPS